MSIGSPSTWRLSTSGGIPYRFVGMSGDFSDENGNVKWRALISSSHLSLFLAELFPPPLIIGNRSIPQAASMPGFPALKAKKISFKSQDDGLPIDPFGADLTANPGTYHGIIEVDVEFGVTFKQDVADPNTFLEISANASGEYINVGGPRMQWVPQYNSNKGDPGDTVPENTADDSQVANPDTGAPAGTTQDKTAEPNKVPGPPVLVRIATTEWTVKWTQIPYDVFNAIIIHRLRVLMGRVNSAPYLVLFGAPAETLLFSGYSYTQQYSWREDNLETPPVKLEMKFIEKRVLWKGVVMGHNHHWRPGYGWQRLLVDGVNPTYGGWNFNLLHQL